YKGGRVRIPETRSLKTVAPAEDDATNEIQEAIDAVSRLDIVDGFRGAVLLQPGIYLCKGQLNLKTSGIVLRGSGSGREGTTLQMTGAPHVAISIAGINT